MLEREGVLDRVRVPAGADHPRAGEDAGAGVGLIPLPEAPVSVPVRAGARVAATEGRPDGRGRPGRAPPSVATASGASSPEPARRDRPSVADHRLLAADLADAEGSPRPGWSATAPVTRRRGGHGTSSVWLDAGVLSHDSEGTRALCEGSAQDRAGRAGWDPDGPAWAGPGKTWPSASRLPIMGRHDRGDAPRRDRQVVRILGILKTLLEGGRPSVCQLAARFKARRETIYRESRSRTCPRTSRGLIGGPLSWTAPSLPTMSGPCIDGCGPPGGRRVVVLRPG
jgi:hypothetical protein